MTARMNLGPGGKQPIMHSTTLHGSSEQSMVYDADEYEWNGPTQHISAELIGKAKA